MKSFFQRKVQSLFGKDTTKTDLEQQGKAKTAILSAFAPDTSGQEIYFGADKWTVLQVVSLGPAMPIPTAATYPSSSGRAGTSTADSKLEVLPENVYWGFAVLLQNKDPTSKHHGAVYVDSFVHGVTAAGHVAWLAVGTAARLSGPGGGGISSTRGSTGGTLVDSSELDHSPAPLLSGEDLPMGNSLAGAGESLYSNNRSLGAGSDRDRVDHRGHNNSGGPRTQPVALEIQHEFTRPVVIRTLVKAPFESLTPPSSGSGMKPPQKSGVSSNHFELQYLGNGVALVHEGHDGSEAYVVVLPEIQSMLGEKGRQQQQQQGAKPHFFQSWTRGTDDAGREVKIHTFDSLAVSIRTLWCTSRPQHVAPSSSGTTFHRAAASVVASSAKTEVVIHVSTLEVGRGGQPQGKGQLLFLSVDPVLPSEDVVSFQEVLKERPPLVAGAIVPGRSTSEPLVTTATLSTMRDEMWVLGIGQGTYLLADKRHDRDKRECVMDVLRRSSNSSSTNAAADAGGTILSPPQSIASSLSAVRRIQTVIYPAAVPGESLLCPTTALGTHVLFLRKSGNAVKLCWWTLGLAHLGDELGALPLHEFGLPQNPFPSLSVVPGTDDVLVAQHANHLLVLGLSLEPKRVTTQFLSATGNATETLVGFPVKDALMSQTIQDGQWAFSLPFLGLSDLSQLSTQLWAAGAQHPQEAAAAAERRSAAPPSSSVNELVLAALGGGNELAISVGSKSEFSVDIASFLAPCLPPPAAGGGGSPSPGRGASSTNNFTNSNRRHCLTSLPLQVEDGGLFVEWSREVPSSLFLRGSGLLQGGAVLPLDYVVHPV